MYKSNLERLRSVSSRKRAHNLYFDQSYTLISIFEEDQIVPDTLKENEFACISSICNEADMIFGTTWKLKVYSFPRQGLL